MQRHFVRGAILSLRRYHHFLDGMRVGANYSCQRIYVVTYVDYVDASSQP